jgi:FKBP12-rapamycin complex-associated protein
MQVIGWSKQRPRRITMHSSRGQQYTFLLKGREDLRQDERVMQLFGLVNALLADARTTARTGLSIQRYVVMPLSNSSGLIGWVPNCDTLHQLVRSYRESREIRVSSEHKALQHAAPDYDRLPLLGKLEVFEQACSTTDGQELARVLWLSSASSEVWLERRTAYIRSLAVMSMAGYILGLGDRHPSNLMLDRVTGRVVHIDFGDCFEVSMQRERYPETVPFRLTRMIVNAMGASRIEGYFRTTCELVMGPLRANRDSLTAMLEAFVHDPLISWRLLSAPSPPQPHARHSSDSSVSKSRSASEVGTIDDNENIDGDIDEIGYGKVVSSPGSPDEGRPLRNIAMSMLGTTPQSNDPGKPRQAAAAGLDRADAEQGQPKEELNAKAVAVLARIQMKLTGRDFGNEPLDVSNQVDQLISQATSPNNLCQLYMGWLPFW